MPRAPDGHASPYRCGSFVDAPHWRLIESANPCAIASACRPCRSIQARRILAPSRVSLPRASKSPDASGARCNRVLIVWISLARTPKTKRPRVLEPEGVRVASGDRGDRSPRCERISRCGWSPGNSACRFRAEAHRAVRTRGRVVAVVVGETCRGRRAYVLIPGATGSPP